jgi:hypothetical protein
MTDRRFNEDEVAAIFRQATEAQSPGQRQLPSGEGLTLAEVQEIGRQVGISPELVTQAAASLMQAGTPTARKVLGLTVGVGRTVELGRKLSDEEWERLVVDLRETFGARGKVTTEGSFRQWTNGNLQVLLEPGANGQRIRLSTVNGNAVRMMWGGQVMFGISAILAAIALFGGANVADLWRAVDVALIGSGMIGLGALTVSGWARVRRKQMEEIAGRLSLGPASLSSGKSHD